MQHLQPWVGISILFLMVSSLASCGTSSAQAFVEPRTATAGVANGEPCSPGPSLSTGSDETLGSRRSEALVLHLTGIDENALPEDEYPTYAGASNFGGVWGDTNGRFVVAVLDCALVDADALARLAGGANRLHLIHVSHTFAEVQQFRDDLVEELGELDVAGQVAIDSTTTGRRLRVVVEDLDPLPSSFGASVPRHLFHAEEGLLFQ